MPPDVSGPARALAGGFDERTTRYRLAVALGFLLLYCTGWLAPLFGAWPRPNWLGYAANVVVLAALVPVLADTARGFAARWWRLLLWSVAALALTFVLSSILWDGIVQLNINHALGITATSSANTERMTELIRAHPLLMTAGGVFVGPLLEELLYRYGLFRALLGVNPVLAHLATAFAFGFQHIVLAVFIAHQPQQWAFIGGYMVFSLVLSLVYQRTRNLAPCLFAHIVSNGLGVAFILLG